MPKEARVPRERVYVGTGRTRTLDTEGLSYGSNWEPSSCEVTAQPGFRLKKKKPHSVIILPDMYTCIQSQVNNVNFQLDALKRIKSRNK